MTSLKCITGFCILPGRVHHGMIHLTLRTLFPYLTAYGIVALEIIVVRNSLHIWRITWSIILCIYIMSIFGQATYTVITFINIHFTQCPYRLQLHWELIYFDKHLLAFITLHFVSLPCICDAKDFWNSQKEILISQYLFCKLVGSIKSLVVDLISLSYPTVSPHLNCGRPSHIWM